LPPAEIGTAQQEFPVTNATASFTEKEFDLLEYAVYTAMRQAYLDGADADVEALSQLRSKLMNHVSEEHCYAAN
jgi:hypothetical protein